jgi:hypothetical protein
VNGLFEGLSDCHRFFASMVEKKELSFGPDFSFGNKAKKLRETQLFKHTSRARYVFDWAIP